MKGGKPKPTALRRLQGNPGRRPFNTNEPRPRSTRAYLLAVPEGLAGDPVAIAKWREKVPLLLASGILTDIDDDVLMLYCQQWSILIAARAKLVEAEEHHLLRRSTSRNKYEIPNPYLTIAAKTTERLRVLAAELGMTPSARTRVKGITPGLTPPPLDDFAEFDESSTPQ